MVGLLDLGGRLEQGRLTEFSIPLKYCGIEETVLLETLCCKDQPNSFWVKIPWYFHILQNCRITVIPNMP